MNTATGVAIGVLTGILWLGACAADDGDLGETAQDDPAGKADGPGGIRFGTYTNHNPFDDEIVKLVLSSAPAADLPFSYFEGKYSLSERRTDGMHASSGFFNVYTSAGRKWIRFLDKTTNAYETVYPKYSWVNLDNTLVASGVGSEDEFFLELPFQGMRLGCKLATLHDEEVFDPDFSESDPNVTFEKEAAGRMKVAIGSWTFDTSQGANIALALNSGGTVATISFTDDANRVRIVMPATAAGPGSLYVKQSGSVEKLVASLTCRGPQP